MDKLARFREMEETYAQVSQEVEAFKESLEGFKQMTAKIEELSKYYGSDEWYDHQEMEARGLLDQEATTAILGEDYIYNTLQDTWEVAIDMLEVSTHILKKW